MKVEIKGYICIRLCNRILVYPSAYFDEMFINMA